MDSLNLTCSADGNDDLDNVKLYDAEAIHCHKEVSLSHGDMVFIAVLRGGDYDNEAFIPTFFCYSFRH